MSALDNQVDGNHYKELKIQPVEYIHANNIPYMEGNVIKYVTRWRGKNGIKDLEKAKHYIELLIEMENKRLDGEWIKYDGESEHPLKGAFAVRFLSRDSLKISEPIIVNASSITWKYKDLKKEQGAVWDYKAIK